MAAMFSASSRRFYVVGDDATSGGYLSRPRFDPVLGLRANAVAMAQREWGERRASWVASLADELLADGAVADDAADAAEWVAAILCAAAADGGRDRRPSTWNRTIAVIADMTGLDRTAVSARHAQLPAVRRAV